MPRALLCFQVGPKTNVNIMVQKWGIYAFSTPFRPAELMGGWLIAVQMINDCMHIKYHQPFAASTTCMLPHTHTLDCILLRMLRPFKKLAGSPGNTLETKTINLDYLFLMSCQVNSSRSCCDMRSDIFITPQGQAAVLVMKPVPPC